MLPAVWCCLCPTLLQAGPWYPACLPAHLCRLKALLDEARCRAALGRTGGSHWTSWWAWCWWTTSSRSLPSCQASPWPSARPSPGTSMCWPGCSSCRHTARRGRGWCCTRMRSRQRLILWQCCVTDACTHNSMVLCELRPCTLPSCVVLLYLSTGRMHYTKPCTMHLPSAASARQIG